MKERDIDGEREREGEETEAPRRASNRPRGTGPRVDCIARDVTLVESAAATVGASFLFQKTAPSLKTIGHCTGQTSGRIASSFVALQSSHATIPCLP